MYTAWLIFDQKSTARLVVMDKGMVRAIYDVTSDTDGRYDSAWVSTRKFNEQKQLWERIVLWEGGHIGGRTLYTLLDPECAPDDPQRRRRCAADYYHAFKAPISYKAMKAIRALVLAESKNVFNQGSQFIRYEV